MSETQEWLKMFAVQGVVLLIMQEEKVAMVEAMERFYNSPWFEKLQNTQTGLYSESPRYIYELYKEFRKGEILK
jgi:hypothetical protein